jgi:5'(3')-deoxyribonucleotidase
MIIAVDVDDVVAEMVSVLLSRYNKDWADNLAIDQITEWDLTKFVKPECGARVFSYFENPSLYDDVKPVPGALAGVDGLRADGHRVVFVTAAAIGTAGAKLDWLRRHGFLEPNFTSANDYVECRDKSLILADVLLDDAVHNITAFKGWGILFDRPWNRGVNRFTRAWSWEDFRETLKAQGGIW